MLLLRNDFASVGVTLSISVPMTLSASVFSIPGTELSAVGTVFLMRPVPKNPNQ